MTDRLRTNQMAYLFPFQGWGLLALFGGLVVGAGPISFRVCIFHNQKMHVHLVKYATRIFLIFRTFLVFRLTLSLITILSLEGSTTLPMTRVSLYLTLCTAKTNGWSTTKSC